MDNRVARCHLLMEVLIADGVLTADEKALLEKHLEDHALSDEEWARYLFVRDNPKGPFSERWVHSAGCRRWFNVRRDTATHRVLGSYRIGEPAP